MSRLDCNTEGKLNELFVHIISKEEYACLLRKFLYETIGMSFRIDKKKWVVNNEVISEGYYWINELCEILDPQLTKEV